MYRRNAEVNRPFDGYAEIGSFCGTRNVSKLLHSLYIFHISNLVQDCSQGGYLQMLFDFHIVLYYQI